MFLVLIFTRGWVDPKATVRSEGNMSLKNPVTPPEIDPGTVRLVAQRLIHYATPGPCWCKWNPLTVPVGPIEWVQVQLSSFLTSALEVGVWSASHPDSPHPRERRGTHCTGGWVGPGAGLDRCGKSRPTGIRSPDLPASRYTDYAILAPCWCTGNNCVCCEIRTERALRCGHYAERFEVLKPVLHKVTRGL
jgi:hypothetical protein